MGLVERRGYRFHRQARGRVPLRLCAQRGGRHRARAFSPRRARGAPAPDAIEEYTLDLGPTSNVFLAGHRLRLEISSSNFPRFERNPNTWRPVAGEQEMVVAHQTIYHDAQHPSHIVLPIIPD